MQTLPKIKIGPFLVISSVLALWTLLAVRPVQAHETTLPTPTCTGLPADAFFGTAETAVILNTDIDPDIATKPGEGTTTRERLRYAKITIPALAAGELRVFHTDADEVSDAVLCRGSSTRATSRTNYSAHNIANSAAVAATRAATAAGESGASESVARTALRRAANALTAAANALTAAGNTADATTASGHASTARGIADATDNAISDVAAALSAAATNLEAARDDFHAPFQIRAEVRPGDESYVLVVAVPVVATPPTTLAVQFHGAIEVGAAGARQGREGNLSAGEIESRSLYITAPGLLTLETTGSTDTTGTLGMNPEVESGGSGGNFKMVVPVEADAANTSRTLMVEGQTSTTTGAYTLNMDFEVAMWTSATDDTTTFSGVTIKGAPTWADDTGISADDTMLQIDGSVIGGGARADEDYFVFEPSGGTSPNEGNGFLTIEATNASGATSHADTTGTLYGPNGEIVTATGGGSGNHFGFTVPVNMMPYLLKVTGTTGQYALQITFAAATDQSTSATGGDPTASVDCTTDAEAAYKICPSTGTGQQERDRYLISVMESGALYVHTTGMTDTRGVLYGPDGALLAEDDNSGQGNNFRLAVQVNPGLHIVEVRGQNRQTQGAYGLVTNFVAGAGPTDPTPPPGTGTDDDVASLQAEITRLRNELNECREPVDTNTRGATLENPPDGGYRSGVGLISGWVCAAEEVEVRILTDRGIHRQTLQVAYGTSRPDTVGACGHGNTGFGMTYNFNHLPEGTYTITAYADGDNQIGDPRTFEVVHLEEFAANDSDRFLRLDEDVQDRGVCIVPDFPATGERTWLKWEESTQNFVIEDAG